MVSLMNSTLNDNGTLNDKVIAEFIERPQIMFGYSKKPDLTITDHFPFKFPPEFGKVHL